MTVLTRSKAKHLSLVKEVSVQELEELPRVPSKFHIEETLSVEPNIIMQDASYNLSCVTAALIHLVTFSNKHSVLDYRNSSQLKNITNIPTNYIFSSDFDVCKSFAIDRGDLTIVKFVFALSNDTRASIKNLEYAVDQGNLTIAKWCFDQLDTPISQMKLYQFIYSSSMDGNVVMVEWLLTHFRAALDDSIFQQIFSYAPQESKLHILDMLKEYDDFFYRM